MDANSVDINPATAEATLEALVSDIQAVPDAQILTCNASGTDMVKVGRLMVPLVTRDRAAIEAVFSSPPMDMMLSIDKRGLAAFAAEKRLESIDPTPVSNLPEIYQEAGDLKTLSVKLLDLIAGNENEVARALDQVRPGTGYNDRANDLGTLHPLLLKYKSKIDSTELMTEAQIDRIGELAPLLLDPKGENSAQLKAAKRLRNQAYTYFVQAYREIRRHATFIHDSNPDALAMYPNLYSRKSFE